MNKKNIISISLIILIFVILGFYYWTGAKKDSVIELTESDTTICNPYANIEEAIMNEDLSVCDCLDEDDLINECIENLQNQIYFNKAINIEALRGFVESCDKITDEIMKNNCQNITAEIVEDMASQDLSPFNPEFINLTSEDIEQPELVDEDEE